MAAQSGRRWFLSYHSPDQDLVEDLAAALRRKDPDAHVFFSSKSLRAGHFWLPELAREIADATAFVLLIGAHGLGPWQVLEYYEALGRRVKQPDFPLLLVLLESQTAPGLPFLRQLHWIVSADPASERSMAQLLDASTGGGNRPSELWRHTAPYRGLAAMTEADADFFFGRAAETAEAIGALAATPDKLALLLGNSGVGKSSLAQAGVLAALLRQGWVKTADSGVGWPASFGESRRWCYLQLRPGPEPLRALVEPFVRTWQFDATDPERAKRLAHWVDDLLRGAVKLRDLLDATQARYRDELRQVEPPAFLLYIDQGEELYARGEVRQRHRFSEVLGEALGDPRLRAMMSMRADFIGEVQKDEALYAVHRQINVPPLRESSLQEVVGRPAELLGASFEMEGLAAYIAGRTAEESARDAGALPLLSYLLDDMWTRMVKRGDGVLRLSAPSFDLGGVLVNRADAFLAAHPDAEERLRRIFTLQLATVYEESDPTRRRAMRDEFSEAEWALVAELADHPNRLLVTSTTDAGVAFAEVAHEAIFRRWGKLRGWISSERKFLAWKTGLEIARREWEAAPERSKRDALLMGLALDTARAWYAERAADLPTGDRRFVAHSVARDQQTRGRAHLARLATNALLAAFIGLLVWVNKAYLGEELHRALMLPYMMTHKQPLTPEEERALVDKQVFRECTGDCPDMVVIPSGAFTMGSPEREPGRRSNEEKPHAITIPYRFAVSKYDVTVAQWKACVSVGGCPRIDEEDSDADAMPVVYVSWDDAQKYVEWLSALTGRSYRLLNEKEWEYAARGGGETAYPWGKDIGKKNANCSDCGSEWDDEGPSPVGSFEANGFGLFDMVGDVYQWVEDCYVLDARRSASNERGGAAESHVRPPGAVGNVMMEACHRVIRGGAWSELPQALRCAARGSSFPGNREDKIGFRVARTLSR